ncbi:MAG: leucine--tRNA ligase [Candidatus Saccharimonadales bacterium]
MNRYNPKIIEPKWQTNWENDKVYSASDKSGKPKKYVLEYFPYPSGAAMHVGHVRNYTIGDVIARYNRMNGYHVLHPMGWDAFGLPAENYAIKNQVSPRVAIDENTKRFKKQLIQMGFSYDWTREIDSSDPDYYKWTQWFFLLLLRKGLAYQNESLQWWCPHDKTVLANEQVENGKCWRCGHEVEKKSLKQWFFKITDYADRLLADLDDLDWSDSIKSMQRNWIGRSRGAEIDFKIVGSDKSLKVFTTRADTIFSAAFMVLAPEHPLVSEITTTDQEAKINEYVKNVVAKSDIQRQADADKLKTGVFTGAFAVNPANQEKIPIWIGDFVLAGYGTGAIFGDIHDERDFDFLNRYKIPARVTVVPENKAEASKVIAQEYSYTQEGILIESAQFSGLRSEAARDKIITWLSEKDCAKEVVNYKMRDWLISRQRYWGAPIPIIHCPKDGAVAVPEDQLPVLLPDVKSYEPSGDGHSPLANVESFVNTTCPTCGGPAKRETDTMDGFACSSWYFLRFADPDNKSAAFDKAKAEFWLPVDDYIGGAEHAVMHLLYARFWTKVMYDAKLINFSEPFKTLRNHGMILAPDGMKMSKSKNNTIEPDEIINQGYGADSIRIMELFIGPWNQVANWSVEGMSGAFRFLQRLYTLTQEYQIRPNSLTNNTNQSDQILKIIHATIKKVSDDLNNLSFNTAISALMECLNKLYIIKALDEYTSEEWSFAIETFLKLLAPIAPHISEELWSQMGHSETIHLGLWPVYNDLYLSESTMIIAVQVNGKLRGEIEIDATANEDQVLKAAMSDSKIKSHLENRTIRKNIYIQSKLVNFVVS